jgi:hypothetical protein
VTDKKVNVKQLWGVGWSYSIVAAGIGLKAQYALAAAKEKRREVLESIDESESPKQLAMPSSQILIDFGISPRMTDNLGGYFFHTFKQGRNARLVFFRFGQLCFHHGCFCSPLWKSFQLCDRKSFFS